MSERFPARKGISASLRQRLGDFGNKATSHEQSRDNFQAKVRDTRKETSKKQDSLSKGYNSGDSLEMDEGDDLRGELDGHHAANMVIQVWKSTYFIFRTKIFQNTLYAVLVMPFQFEFRLLNRQNVMNGMI